MAFQNGYANDIDQEEEQINGQGLSEFIMPIMSDQFSSQDLIYQLLNDDLPINLDPIINNNNGISTTDHHHNRHHPMNIIEHLDCESDHNTQYCHGANEGDLNPLPSLIPSSPLPSSFTTPTPKSTHHHAIPPSTIKNHATHISMSMSMSMPMPCIAMTTTIPMPMPNMHPNTPHAPITPPTPPRTNDCVMGFSFGRPSSHNTADSDHDNYQHNILSSSLLEVSSPPHHGVSKKRKAPKPIIDDKRKAPKPIIDGNYGDGRISIIVSTEVLNLHDGYGWRKYGQKIIKNDDHPRSYFRCAQEGCEVQKHIQKRTSNEVMYTYVGKHNHHAPNFP